MNYPELIRWVLIALLLNLLAVLIILPVHAEIPRIAQGDQVEIGQHYDITGVAAGEESLAWYGISGFNDDPLYILDLPVKRSEYFNFYIDPAIFGQRLGPWFKFYGNTTGTEHGNLKAFYVVRQIIATNKTVNVTITPTPTPTPEPTIVSPKKFDTDFQIAYGDPLTITINNLTMPSRLWVFGREDAFYNRSYPTSKVNITADDILSLESGPYTLIIQNPGKNGIFEVGYMKTVLSTTTEELVSPWAHIPPRDIFGLQPRMVLVHFREMAAQSDDVLTEYRLEVASPMIEMVSVDERYNSGKDILDVRGYTNVARGTEITFVMDKEKQTARTMRSGTFMEIVREDAPNTWRYFQILIPIDYTQIPVGQHIISASTPQGATQSIPYWVYSMPEGQATPNQTVKYMGGNQFIPPVTVTITIPIPGPTQIVTVPVTPSNEQVYAQQKIAEDKKWEEKKSEYFTWGFWIFIIVIMILIGCYGISVVKRARLK